MNRAGRPLLLGIIAGEESGDILGADLVNALNERTGSQCRLLGVGGSHLQALGLRTIFEPDDIAIMGLNAVVRDLPRLVARISSTSRKIAQSRPDCLVLVDSPAFNLRVARNVRRIAPEIPIVKYVCPSVWAWNPGRAAKMRPHIDHVLCLLPFEPGELERLGGPQGTFVGHRLTHDPDLLGAARQQSGRQISAFGARKTLLALPGSRRAEVRRLMADFEETFWQLKERGNDFELIIATVPRVAGLVEHHARQWRVKPEIVVGAKARWDAFSRADAALAASGTILLELALCAIPTISTYKADLLMRMFSGLITTWSAALPNLIADRVVIPEYYDKYLRPGLLARLLERLMNDTPERKSQMEGFREVERRMKTQMPAGDVGAQIVLAEIAKRSTARK